MKDALKDQNMKKIAKEISKFSISLPNEIKKLNENDKKRYLTELDGAEYLENAKDYLKVIFSCDIEIYRTDEKKIYYPANRARNAIPLRPAIYIK